MKAIFYIGTIVLLCTVSCDKDCYDPSNPSCTNYDACKYGHPKTSADFVIEQPCGKYWFETDLVNMGDLVRFRAKDTSPGITYLWTIGARNYTTRSVSLDGFPDKTWINITLQISKPKPNNPCYPLDNGKDTVQKRFYAIDATNLLYDYTQNLPPRITNIKVLNGRYSGYNARNPNRYFTMECRSFFPMIQVDPNLPNSRMYLEDEQRRGEYQVPQVDFTNIPYEGTGIHSAFFGGKKILKIVEGYDVQIDGMDLIDLPGGNTYANFRCAHYSFYANEAYKDSCEMAKYYSFFKSYAYLDYKDLDKITIEYWYRDTITRRIIKDTFFGRRI